MENAYFNCSKMHMKVKVKVAQSCPALCNLVDYSPWNSPGLNTGVEKCT